MSNENVYTMENDKLRVTVADAGAELISLYDKVNGRETVWQADPKFWARHTPVLFPNVGKYYGGHFTYQGKEYKEGQHGFARDNVFQRVAEGADYVTHRLSHDMFDKAAMANRYPFAFAFEVTHKLEGNKVTVQWHVINEGAEDMYFTVGGHPAFNVPAIPGTAYIDYSLQFAADVDKLEYVLLDTASGTAIADTKYELVLTDHAYKLREGMFDKDALVFDDNQIKQAGLTLPDGSPYITMICGDDIPNFGIWAKPGADFVCLEPWCGRCDNCGFVGEISEKPGINKLGAKEEFLRSYDIVVG